MASVFNAIIVSNCLSGSELCAGGCFDLTKASFQASCQYTTWVSSKENSTYDCGICAACKRPYDTDEVAEVFDFVPPFTCVNAAASCSDISNTLATNDNGVEVGKLTCEDAPAGTDSQGAHYWTRHATRTCVQHRRLQIAQVCLVSL